MGKEREEAAAVMDFPSLQCIPLDRIRVREWGTSGGGKPRHLCHGPHLLFIALRDRDPPALLGLDAPHQGVSQGPMGRWAHWVKRST